MNFPRLWFHLAVQRHYCAASEKNEGGKERKDIKSI